MLSEWLKHLYVCPNIYGPYCIRRIIVYATQKHPWLKVKVITINLSLSNHCDIIHILPVYHGYVYTILQDLQSLRGIELISCITYLFYQISTKYQLFKILSSVYIYIYIYMHYLLTLWKYIWFIYNSYLVRVLFLHISVVCMAGFSAMIHTDSFLCPH